MRFPTLHGIIWNLTRNEAGRRKAAFGVIDDVIGLDSKRFEVRHRGSISRLD